MASNSFFSGRIPPKLHQSVREYCKESDKSQTDVLIEALSNYLNLPVQDKDNKSGEVTKEMYNSLVERIEILEEKLNDNNVIDIDNTDKQNICHHNIEVEIDNINYNNDQEIEKAKEIRLTNKEVAEKIGISISQVSNIKKQIIEEAKNKKYKIEKCSRFPEPIEVIQKRKKSATNNQLICLGLDEKLKPIWVVKEHGNDILPLNIIESSISESSN